MIFLYLNIKRVSFCRVFSFLLPNYMLVPSMSLSIEQPHWVFMSLSIEQPCWVFFSGMAVRNWTYFPGLAELLAHLSAFCSIHFSEKLFLSRLLSLYIHSGDQSFCSLACFCSSAKPQNLSFANKLLLSLGQCSPPTIYIVTCKLM